MMEKQMILKDVDFVFDEQSSLDASYEGMEINLLQKELEAAKALGANHVKIECGDFYIRLYAVCYRKETDEEFNKRVESEKNLENKTIESELKELARLKAKYEK